MAPPHLHALVDRWLEGYAVSRGLSVAREGALAEIEINAGGRRWERVLTEPDVATLDAAMHGLLGTDSVWLTVFTAEPLTAPLPDGVRLVLDVEVLMTTELDHDRRPGGTRAVVVPDGDRATATVWEGEVSAASGVVALVGDLAVFDRIGTHEAHRRRGLGTDVMAALAGWAHDRGARRGVLAASVDGQALYTRLGWEVDARMTSLAAG